MAKQITEKAAADRLECDLGPFQLAHEFSRKLDIKSPEFKRYTGSHYGEQAKYVSVRFTEAQVKKWGKLEILHMTDVQWGHVRCKHDRVKEFINWVLAEPWRFVVFGGDMVDAYRIGSPGEPWENTFNPQKQIYQFCSVFAPLAHRVLGFVGGNHERRANIAFGDLGTLLATLLRIPYSGGKQFVDVHFGDHKPFKIELWHGKGASITKGSKMNMLQAAMTKSDAQMVFVGHLHEPLSTFDWKISRDTNNFKIKMMKQGGAMSSSFLEYWSSYAEMMNLSPCDTMMAVVTLDPDAHWQLSLR